MIVDTEKAWGRLPAIWVGLEEDMILPHPHVQLHSWPIPEDRLPNSLGLHVFVPHLDQAAEEFKPQFAVSLGAHFHTKASLPEEFYSLKLASHMRHVSFHPSVEQVLHGYQHGVNILHLDSNGRMGVSDSVRFAAGKYCPLASVYCYWALFSYLEATLSSWTLTGRRDHSAESLHSTFSFEISFLLSRMRAAGILITSEHWAEDESYHIEYVETCGQKTTWVIGLPKLTIQATRSVNVGRVVELQSLFPVMFRLFPWLDTFQLTSLMTKNQMYTATLGRWSSSMN